jgi:four helix bundle protein
MIKSYKDLKVWQLGMGLVEGVYRLTRGFPREEIYGLSAQMRRAAISVPSNVAEGHARSTREYLHHLSIALGSLAELETQLLVAARFGHVDEQCVRSAVSVAEEIGKMLRGLQKSLRAKLSLVPSP